MIHYSCDLCGQSIQERYTAKIEVALVLDEKSNQIDHDLDPLDLIAEQIEELNSTGEFELDQTGPRVFEYDLCHACAVQYLKSPLSPPSRSRMNYSQN